MRKESREPLFRYAMAAMIEEDRFQFPPSLRRDILDHLERRDSNGWILCFDSIQREHLISLVYQWAATHCREVAVRLMLLDIYREKGLQSL